MVDKAGVKTLLLQYCPAFRNIEKSIQQLNELLSDYSVHDEVDLIVLPELAFSGKSFFNKPDIIKYTTEQNSGLIFEWAKDTAKSFQAVVIFGYAECVNQGQYIYNSMAVISHDGQLIKNYRKTKLDYIDRYMFYPGQDYDYVDVYFKRIQQTKRLGLGIGMDIWHEDATLFENMGFAEFHKQNQSDIIVVINNQLELQQCIGTDVRTQVQITFWLNRFCPFTSNKDRSLKTVYFLCCSRIGKEFAQLFSGCSCVLQIQPRVKFIKNLDCEQRGILDTTLV